MKRTDWQCGFTGTPTTLGEHIRKVRTQRGLTQKQAAELIGVDEETVYGWEVGINVPRVSRYPAIIAFVRYYPFDHETDSIAGKLLQVRYCNGWTCKELALTLGIDTATVRRWELKKSTVLNKCHAAIMDLWVNCRLV